MDTKPLTDLIAKWRESAHKATVEAREQEGTAKTMLLSKAHTLNFAADELATLIRLIYEP